MKKQIFDLLECLPADIDESNIKPEFDIDPEKVKADLHDRIDAEKNNKHHSVKKRRRRLTVITAVAVLITISLVGGTIIACAMTGVSEEDEMQQRLTEEFNARVDEIYDNEADRIVKEYSLSEFDMTKEAFDNHASYYPRAVRAEAAAEERKKVCNIINKYLDNKYESYSGYFENFRIKEPHIEEYFEIFRFIRDCCNVYNNNKETLSVEEKMRILNYLDAMNAIFSHGYMYNAEHMSNYDVELRYPDEYPLWGEALNAIQEIMNKSHFAEKYIQGYYPKSHFHYRKDITEYDIEIENTESSDDSKASEVSE